MGEQAVVYYQFKGLGHTFAEIEKNTKNVRVAKIFIKPEKIGVIMVSFNTTSKQDKNTTLRTFANIILHMSMGKQETKKLGIMAQHLRVGVTWRGQSLF